MILIIDGVRRVHIGRTNTGLEVWPPQTFEVLDTSRTSCSKAGLIGPQLKCVLPPPDRAACGAQLSPAPTWPRDQGSKGLGRRRPTCRVNVFGCAPRLCGLPTAAGTDA
jgi:hypothetical protein